MVVKILEPDSLGLNPSSFPYQWCEISYIPSLPQFFPLKIMKVVLFVFLKFQVFKVHILFPFFY